MKLTKTKDTLFKLGVGSLVFMPNLSFASCADQQGKGLEAVTGQPCDPKKLPGAVNDVINTLFIVVGSITVIIIIVAGIRYITSTGDATRIAAAKNTLLYAIIGLIVVILARFIVGFVIGKIA